MATFSIRTAFLLTAAIATIYPVVRPPSAIAFPVWLLFACVVWGAAGISLRNGKSHRNYFLALCIVPLLIAVSDNFSVAIYDGWPHVTIHISLPPEADASTAILHYIPLPQRDMLPFVLEKGTEVQEAVHVADMGQPVKLRTGYAYRGSKFGNTWDHSCEYDIVVFLAALPDGITRYGVVELPDRYDPRPLSIKWMHATEQTDEPER